MKKTMLSLSLFLVSSFCMISANTENSDPVLNAVDAAEVTDVTRGCGPCDNNLCYQKFFTLQSQIDALKNAIISLQACCATNTATIECILCGLQLLTASENVSDLITELQGISSSCADSELGC